MLTVSFQPLYPNPLPCQPMESAPYMLLKGSVQGPWLCWHAWWPHLLLWLYYRQCFLCSLGVFLKWPTVLMDIANSVQLNFQLLQIWLLCDIPSLLVATPSFQWCNKELQSHPGFFAFLIYHVLGNVVGSIFMTNPEPHHFLWLLCWP